MGGWTSSDGMMRGGRPRANLGVTPGAEIKLTLPIILPFRESNFVRGVCVCVSDLANLAFGRIGAGEGTNV